MRPDRNLPVSNFRVVVCSLVLYTVLPLLVLGKTIDCSTGEYGVLETIPPDLNLSLVGATHFDGWMRAMEGARKIQIAALYADMNAPTWAANQSNSGLGLKMNQTFYKLARAGTSINLITNDCASIHYFDCSGALQWRIDNVMDVTLSPWNVLVSEGLKSPVWGVQHAKVMTFDGLHAYSGSANLAWSSLSQTKELGLMVYNCSALTKIFDNVISMWILAGKAGEIPSSWPSELLPTANAQVPLNVKIRSSASQAVETLEMFPCYSPPSFNYTPGSDCSDVIRSNLLTASTMVAISLMDYSPTSLYQVKQANASTEFYWDKFDAPLRFLALQGVQVRLLISNWSMTFPLEVPYWRSLDALPNVEVRQFQMPAYEGQPGPRRVNHDKFFVTDDLAYIGTSNWSGDYYEYFGGLGWTVKGGSLRDTLLAAFDRDWESAFVHRFDEAV